MELGIVAALALYSFFSQSWRLNLVNIKIQRVLTREQIGIFDLLSPTSSAAGRLAVSLDKIPAADFERRRSHEPGAATRLMTRFNLIMRTQDRIPTTFNSRKSRQDEITIFLQSVESAARGNWKESLDLMQAMYPAMKNTWIHHLRLAREAAAGEFWSNAVDEYRRAMIYLENHAAIVFPEYEHVTSSLMKISSVESKYWKYFYRLGRSLWRLGDWSSAQEAYQLLISSVPPVHTKILAEAYDRMGQVEERAGRLNAALQLYEQAWGLNRREPDLYEHLRKIYSLTNNKEALARLEKEATEWLPSYPVSIPDSISNISGWTLLGFEFNRDDLEWGGPLEMTFYWYPVNSNSIPQGQGWIAMGDKWALKEDTVNLFFNGGFEWSLDCGPYPCGFSPFYSGAQPIIAIVKNEELNDTANYYLQLQSSSSWPDSILGATFLPISLSGESYLQAGRYRGPDAHISIGAAFSLSFPADPWRFTVSDRASPEWQLFSSILITPTNAQRMRLALSNWKGTGPADLDDLIFTRLPVPAQEASESLK